MLDVYTLIDKTSNQNDRNDTIIINELYRGRVDALITEDKQLLYKASLLGISDRAYTIDGFLEKVTVENPELADYKVLSVRKSLFGNLNLSDNFFTSFREDYPDYEKWFNKKADETVYVCLSEGKPIAPLYLKAEGKNEDYTDMAPPLPPKRRPKIGSFKVTLNGFRLGERFLKIVFDNALRLKVDEVYVTIFDKRIEQQRLINLLEEYGFYRHGFKRGPGGNELVYVRSCERFANRLTPKLTYPFFSTEGRVFIVPIYPEYHTELFPDSILRTESPMDFVENEPHRNAISKVYISRSIERNLHSGDVIIFYRTSGYYKSVVTTIGVAESVIDNIPTEVAFVRLCRKRSVFSDKELSKQWNYERNRPFIVNLDSFVKTLLSPGRKFEHYPLGEASSAPTRGFYGRINLLYAYSFPRRINMKRLIEIGVIPSVNDAPRGFTPISVKNLRDILRECQVDESIVVD